MLLPNAELVDRRSVLPTLMDIRQIAEASVSPCGTCDVSWPSAASRTSKWGNLLRFDPAEKRM